MLLAIDPGKNIGMAIVDQNERLLEHFILSLEELNSYEFQDDLSIVVGDGTGSEATEAILKKRAVNYTLVDETGTSLEARSLYFKDNTPKGLLRLLPASLRSPPELIDDYAAYAIALRYLRAK